MLRSSSIIATYRQDQSSSPDPLANSFNDETDSDAVAITKRPSSPSRPRALLKHTKKTAEANRRETALRSSSPFRSIHEQNCSPWKIRVTVEAEPEDSSLAEAAQMTMTRTMKIPLRQESSPMDGMKSSGRGRRSSATSVKSKRGATPVRETRNSSRSRRQSVTNLDVIPLGDDAEEDDWLKQKKSPRKKRGSQPRKSTSATQPEKPTTTTFEIRQDTDAGEDNDGLLPQEQGPDDTSPELRSIDLNRVSLRQRATSTKSKADEESAPQSEDNYPAATLMQKPSDVRKVSANSAMSYPTPSPSASYHGNSDDVGNALLQDQGATQATENFDPVLESEGFTMIDLDTLPSAKQYLNNRSNFEESHLSETRQENVGGPSSASPQTNKASATDIWLPHNEAITYPALNVDESDISSTVPSSPPVLAHDNSLLHVASASSNGMVRKVTPLLYSSPKLPSPPRQTAQKTSNHRHRGSASALFAGIALQEIVSPDHPKDVPVSKQEIMPKQHGRHIDEDRLYQGFDDGTKRELRAGLRFGEELAKRQSPSANIDTVNAVDYENNRERAGNHTASSSQPISRSQQQTRVWRGETLVQHTPVGLSNTTNTDAAQSTRQVLETPQGPTSDRRITRLLDTQARREHEWQLERQAVSRQIENASESQVIVLDSDDETQAHGDLTVSPQQNESSAPAAAAGEDDEEDIWLAEAKKSSSPQPELQPTLQPSEKNEAKRSGHQDREIEPTTRPRRSLIPNTWRRAAPADQSTFLSTKTDDMSGLMDLQEQESKIKFGAGEIKRQRLGKRRSSGAFDIDAMLGTPKEDFSEAENSESLDTYDDEQHQPQVDDTSISESGHESSVLTQDVEASTINPISPEQPPSPTPRYDHGKIPVNLDDSSIAVTTPPDTIRVQLQPPSSPANPISSPQRPPTPRSAMKGSRQSFGEVLGLQKPDTPTMMRRVIFSQRSRGVTIDGLESSFSMKTVSDESTLGSVGAQLNRELQAHEDDDQGPEQFEGQNAHEETLDSVSAEESPTPQAERRNKGWTGWTLGSKDAQAQTVRPQIVPAREESSHRPQPRAQATAQPQPKSKSSKWQPTKSSIASVPASTTTSSKSRVGREKIPSYLLPPSYPSDPSRSPATPLSLSGTFTNSHFRTLHIIYRKSLRPKFHAPPAHDIRPEILELNGAAMDVDETDSGVGEVFTFTMGLTECQVLERFMQECEYSCGVFGQSVKEAEWEWSVGEIAERLCRIVVGEVVRDEERKAAKGR
ncbi:hypothetical protein PV11_08975 [Exophiala sideris]|uniref:Uncharacterized protein n=1 Tax=Exophiala sideris TaxID=1016849 RepID=A0A0D1Y2N0_9EURO|nr:hypothetical protein PV11_08975 [Exophiala sideris]